MQQAYCFYSLFISRNNLALALPFLFKQKRPKTRHRAEQLKEKRGKLTCGPLLSARNMLYQQRKEKFQDECAKELIGSIAITRYNNRTYRIDDIEWNKSPSDTFLLMNGSKTTFVEYYR